MKQYIKCTYLKVNLIKTTCYVKLKRFADKLKIEMRFHQTYFAFGKQNNSDQPRATLLSFIGVGEPMTYFSCQNCL